MILDMGMDDDDKVDQEDSHVPWFAELHHPDDLWDGGPVGQLAAAKRRAGPSEVFSSPCKLRKFRAGLATASWQTMLSRRLIYRSRNRRRIGPCAGIKTMTSARSTLQSMGEVAINPSHLRCY